MLYKIYYGKWNKYYSANGLNHNIVSGKITEIQDHSYFIPNEYFGGIKPSVFEVDKLSYHDGYTWRLF